MGGLNGLREFCLVNAGFLVSRLHQDKGMKVEIMLDVFHFQLRRLGLSPMHDIVSTFP